MKYSEVFYSIQGEGMYTGVPSVFFRLFGCQLFCLYCDSKFSLYEHSEMKKDSPEKISDMLLQYKCNHIVITGGEPMLQKDELHLLMTLLRKKNPNVIITIETNGIIYDDRIQPDVWSVSPKTTNSFKISNDEYNNVNLVKKMKLHFKNNTYSNLPNFYESDSKCQFKFVISSISDIVEVKHIINKYRIPKSMVWLMPEGISVEHQRQKSLFVIELCKKEGFNFCTRLHIYLWGDKRGV